MKIYGASVNINFQDKKMPKEKAPCSCLSNNNARFRYQSKEKVLYSNALGRMQI